MTNTEQVVTELASTFTEAAKNLQQESDMESEETETERILLHEMFTGSNCGPCQPADEKLLAVLHDNPGEYHLISYQICSGL